MSTTTNSVVTNFEQKQQMNFVELPSRAVLRRARRVCVKAGTSVVTNDDGRPSLTRLGSLAEQISELVNSGVEVIFVSSGAVGMGKRLLRKQSKMLMTLKDNIITSTTSHDSMPGSNNSDGTCTNAHSNIDDAVINMLSSRRSSTAQLSRAHSSFEDLIDSDYRAAAAHTYKQKKKFYDSACASAGQFEMMNLYSSLFSQCEVVCSQLLVTQMDFIDPSRLQNLTYAIERLLSLGIVPIINENDAVSGNMGYTPDDVFSDNDSLAALCSRNFGAEVLLLLTDVQGVYDRPPSDPDAKLLSYYDQTATGDEKTIVQIGEKSAQGRGGMSSKIDAALSAVQSGSPTRACVVAAGHDLNSIRSILGPNGSSYGSKGTLFCQVGTNLDQQAKREASAVAAAAASSSASKANNRQPKNDTLSVSSTQQEQQQQNAARQQAIAARVQARKLQTMSYEVRRNIILAIADALLTQQDEILEANLKDVDAAASDEININLQKRLKLTSDKINTLVTGLKQIATMVDPLGVTKTHREVSDGLVLQQVTVAIGVLMIIFESRPDSMPQISALALITGNGLLLKGGKEATHSNAMIHKIIGDAIEAGSNNTITRDIIGLVTTREQIADMLVLDDVIDLVIPRGSNALVSYIKANTRIPVLGHADGVCHVYVDSSADTASAIELVVDSKTDYPSACNAMETLLLHTDTISNGVAASTLMSLRKVGVKCLGGPKAMSIGLCDNPAKELKYEYGDLTCLVEVVDTIHDAIDWIHTYGSGHTEAIVCNKDATDVINTFVNSVDAACVFVNASTRFADGYRFGLGAEVGISTGRIHARGPVGVEGLVTTKWKLQAIDGTIHTVSQYSGDNPSKQYTHKEIIQS
jgi:delta-1-pyrroline-5-carboxylate synthetase